MKNNKQQQKAAKIFAENWQRTGYEKGNTSKFWIDLLTNVFGVKEIFPFIFFEERVKEKFPNKTITNYIDAYIPSTRVMIEQKSSTEDLQSPIRQSDGTMLTPFQQSKRYVSELPLSQHPKWIVACNFKEFLVYDMENPTGDPQRIFLKDLEKEYYRLQFLVDDENDHLKRELEVSVKATELVGHIYDKLLEQYIDKTDAETLRSLNVLCVRLVFCLYAEDAVLFSSKTAFHDYLAPYPAKELRHALIDLFHTLDTPVEQRDPYMDETLAKFPYVNGGLFGHDITIPQFTDDIKQLLLHNASADFDWSEISPTIFGALFESTLNPDTRRKGGMHYTSIENIHKVIDPLFMDDLRAEFYGIVRANHHTPQLNRKLLDFQKKIASLTFLDPACGSGNFLTETYMSLRRLENEVIMEMTKGQVLMGFEEVNPVKVSIHQFYGIEINDFAVDVAKTALWIAENQMLQETEKIIDRDLEMLPLKSYSNIRRGNALRMDWGTLEETPPKKLLFTEKLNIYHVRDFETIPAVSDPPATYTPHSRIYQELDVAAKAIEQKELTPHSETLTHITYDYIMGNPPFSGYGPQTISNKEDTLFTYIDENGKSYRTAGKIDYVANWYFKAAQFIQGTKTLCAFVSTNSICQGEQVAKVWKPIFERFQIDIDFAYQTFRWFSESSDMAHVHCVIIGFSHHPGVQKNKKLFITDGTIINASQISPYLRDEPTVWIENRSTPLCIVPRMTTGNRPADGGHLIMEPEEYEDFIKKEPDAKKWIKKLTGAEEYINNKKRYCLWLVAASPAEIRSMKEVYKRVMLCRDDRLKGAPDRQKLADTPTVFREIKNPEQYLIVPRVSSEKRRYIPIGFLNGDTIPTDSATIIMDAGLYEFGILTSKVHMAWMRAVGGRLKSDYRYSKDIVYNNFPWPFQMENEKRKIEIEKTAQDILDARSKYPDSSLADLYDPLTMPSELRKAHEANDKAVMQAYGFDPKMTEDEIVAELFKLYQKLTKQ